MNTGLVLLAIFMGAVNVLVVGPGGRIWFHVGIEAVVVVACLVLTAWRRSLLPGLVAAVVIVALWRGAGLG